MRLPWLRYIIIPNVRWGETTLEGLEGSQARAHPEKFLKFGMSPSRGVLFFMAPLVPCIILVRRSWQKQSRMNVPGNI